MLLPRPPANALLVVDVQNDHSTATCTVAQRIHTFVGEHTDDYKVVVATKFSPELQFHPELRALPDTPDPYDAENTDFDSVFYGQPGTGHIRAALQDAHGEYLNSYLNRHGIGHVDVVGVDVSDMALETNALGFTTTVLLPMVAEKFSTTDIMGLAAKAIQVEGLIV